MGRRDVSAPAAGSPAAAAAAAAAAPAAGARSHPRVDAGQSQKPIPQIYKRIDFTSQFKLPLTKSMVPTARRRIVGGNSF